MAGEVKSVLLSSIWAGTENGLDKNNSFTKHKIIELEMAMKN